MSLRVGIVGCGGISRSHAAAYANLKVVDFAAVCDIDPESLAERADEHGVTGRYVDYEEMFAAEELALVSVCTHAPLHGPVTIAAANAGIHVLCEKPLSVDLEMADRMVTACRDAGVHLAVSHQYRFSPPYRRAKAFVEDGKIGALRSIREVGKGREAGFELMEMGVHYFDEMDLFMGHIDWVHAQMTYEGRDVTVNDIMHSRELCPTDNRDNGMVAGDRMLVHLSGGAGVSGVVELYPREAYAGWLAGPHLLGDTAQLMCKQNPKTGTVETWFCPSDVSFAAHTSEWELVEIEEAAYVIDGQIWDSRHSIWSVHNVVSAILDGKQPELGGEKALTSLECVSGSYESHFTRSRAYLPLADRRHPLVKRLGNATTHLRPPGFGGQEDRHR